MLEQDRFDEDMDEVWSFFEDDEADDEARRGGRRGGGGRILGPQRPPVRNATLTTPRGNATIQLPEGVVSEQAFNEAVQRLEAAINKVAGQVADSRDAADKAAKQQRLLARATKAGFLKAKRQQQEQNTTNFLMTFLLAQDQKRRLESHKHIGGTPVDTATLPADNSLLYLLIPMLGGMGGGGGSGDKEGGGGGGMSMMLPLILLLTIK